MDPTGFRAAWSAYGFNELDDFIDADEVMSSPAIVDATSDPYNTAFTSHPCAMPPTSAIGAMPYQGQDLLPEWQAEPFPAFWDNSISPPAPTQDDFFMNDFLASGVSTPSGLSTPQLSYSPHPAHLGPSASFARLPTTYQHSTPSTTGSISGDDMMSMRHSPTRRQTSDQLELLGELERVKSEVLALRRQGGGEANATDIKRLERQVDNLAASFTEKTGRKPWDESLEQAQQQQQPQQNTTTTARGGRSEDLRCWDHGCNGRKFSTYSNLVRHQREREDRVAKPKCSWCGAEFSRASARNVHEAERKCKPIRMRMMEMADDDSSDSDAYAAKRRRQNTAPNARVQRR